MARTYEKQAFTPECVPEILKGTAFMEEAGADTFEISDLPFVPSGVLAHVLRSDDVAIAVDGTYTNGKAVVTLVADCYHVAGRLSVAIYITDASMNSQCVYACVGNVYRTVGDTELDSGTEVPTLAQLEAAYQACVVATGNATSAAAAAVGNFAVAFAEGTANAPGTYVTYSDGKMYYLPDGHTANVTWANTTKNEVTAGGELTDLKGAFDSITTGTVDPSQLYDDSNPNIINAYSNGVNFIGGSNFRTLYIPCKPNTAYTISWTANIFGSMTVIQAETTPVPGGSAMSFSAENTTQWETISGRVYCTNITESNANYLAVYYCNTNTASVPETQIRATIMIAEGTEKTEYRNYTINLEIKESALPEIMFPETYERGSYARADSMTANDEISFSVGNIKKNNVIGFSANIGTFGSLMIGQGKTALNQTAYIVIDSTTVKVYRYTTVPVEWVSLNHGLTIADYIDVCIEVSDTEIGWAKLRITSNGRTYTYNRMAWMGCGATVYANAISGSYTNCNLSYFCADYDKDFWLFGDSYFDHWVTYALSYGSNNFLCDGYSGRKSEAAYTSLERNMHHGKPNTIVWCMGMNDGDSSSVVNASWVNYYTLLVSLAEANNINLILCTIPNTPTVNNTYKNAIIRNSGHRYIDLAKIVGSDISSSWYAGLLSSDNVHPSTLGDEMIARFFESAIPEIK